MIQNDIYDEFLNDNSTVFLKDLTNKIKSIKKNIKDLEKCREKIIDKIVNEDRVIDSTDKRKYKNDSETALECVNTISKNYYELSNEYNTINQLNGFILKRFEENEKDFHIKIYVGKLKTEIKHTEELENRVEEDNEKNYLIINNFLDGIEEDNTSCKINYQGFKDVTFDNLEDNLVLKIGESVVELPYTKREIEEYLKEYPNDYKTPQDVIKREFVTCISIYKRFPILARFKEAYYLCRTKEMMTIIDSFKYAKNYMFRSDVNAYIIAASKSRQQLEDYIECLENNRLDDFKAFKVVYEINPATIV